MLTGTISKIIYSGGDFIVALLSDTKVCGTLPGAVEGLKVTLYGDFQEHPRYGRQFVFTRYRVHSDSPYPYLSSGLVKGVGPSMAKKIVGAFPDPIDVILKTPLRLTCISGISAQKALDISRSVRETLQYRETAAVLAPCRFSPRTLMKVHHGLNPADVLNDPYVLTNIDGIGFLKADRAAQRLGVSPDSPERIKAALRYSLKESAEKDGHVFMPGRELAVRAFKLLGEKVSPALIEENLKTLDLPREEGNVYLPRLLEAENGAASFFSNYSPPDPVEVGSLIGSHDVALSPSQRKAVEMAFRHGVLVVTGGPGTGKTETVRAVVDIHKKLISDRIILAAPTGRASRRISEVTGLEAKTIHRLIRDKISAGLVVVDETSMVDLELFFSFLKCIRPKTRLIFVGDPDQLPSVGPGQVLRDIIDILPTVRLTQVFRQAEQSDIVLNAHRINSGNLNIKTGRDFYFIEKNTPEAVLEFIEGYLKKFLAQRGSLDGLQILTPMKKGVLGADELNRLAQRVLGRKPGFNPGDRVIQLTNSYSKNVFNGEIGVIASLEPLTVMFDREVIYESYEADQLSLAYAVTVHKSQGSEFPVVLIPLHTQHYVMLSRRILYTAVTRAKKMAILVGSFRALALAVGNEDFGERNSNLRKKIKKVSCIT